jgi:tetratricopeptide (TPR) repeat protein
LKAAVILGLCALCGALPSSVAAQDVSSSSTDVQDESGQSAAEVIDKGYALMKRGRLTDAIKTFAAGLRVDPKNKRGRFGLGTVLIQMQEYRRALDVLEPLSEEYPNDHSLKNNIAWLYATAEDPKVRNGEKAIGYAQEALLVAPRDYHVWSTLAEAYYVLGDYEKAVRASEEALILARQRKASASELSGYKKQFEKCRTAHEAMSLID